LGASYILYARHVKYFDNNSGLIGANIYDIEISANFANFKIVA
jgi:hypothetical protein